MKTTEWLGAVVCVSLAAGALVGPMASGAPSDHMCWNSRQEDLSGDFSGYRLELKSMKNLRPDQWEQSVYQALHRLVDKHNATATVAGSTVDFEFHMAAGGYDRRVHRYLTAAVLCRWGKPGGPCRNRNFWSPKTSDPAALAATLFENLRVPNPPLGRCEKGAFGYSIDW